MKRRKGFTLIELLVVIAIIALLMAIMMPALSKAKALARDLLCMSNMKNWGLFFMLYTGDHDDYFYEGLKQGGPVEGMWYHALRRYYAPSDPAFFGTRNPATNSGYWWGIGDDVMRCPMAANKTLPPSDLMVGGDGRWYDPFTSWGIFTGYNSWGSRWEKGLWGSYGVSAWLANQADKVENDQPIGAKGYWRHCKQKDTHAIPLMMGCTWYQGWPGPFHHDEPSKNEFHAGGNGMRGYCLNRHNGFVNGVFMNGSPRKVGLKEVWTLKWHRVFKINGEWTLAGNQGVAPNWPAWMQGFKDF